MYNKFENDTRNYQEHFPGRVSKISSYIYIYRSAAILFNHFNLHQISDTIGNHYNIILRLQFLI